MTHALPLGLSSEIFVPSTVMPEEIVTRHPSRGRAPKGLSGCWEVIRAGSTIPFSERRPLLLRWAEQFDCLQPRTIMETPACIQPP